MQAIKKQTAIALFLLLLIPAIVVFDGVLFRFIDPEIAAGHPNYAQNYHMLEVARRLSIWASAGVIAILWLVVCFLVIRSMKRSWLWIFLAVFGPFGFAALAMLNDNAPATTDPANRMQRLSVLPTTPYLGSVADSPRRLPEVINTTCGRASSSDGVASTS